MSDKELTRKETGVNTPAHDDRLRKVLPGVNIYENHDEILLQVELPGVSKEEITIDIDNGRLALAARRQRLNNGTPLYAEFGPVEFHRAFSVPQSINSDKVHAEFRNGILNLHLPKSDAFKPRSIQVKEG